MLPNFFYDFSDRSKLLIVVLAFFTITILLSLLIGGWLATSLITIPALLGILQVTKGVWTPEGGGKSKIGLTSLGIALAAIATNQFWRPYINSLLGPLYDEIPSLKDKLPTESLSISALLFLAFVILVVNYFARDKSAMKEHPDSIEKEFPEKDYKKSLEFFCGVLLDDLNKIDRETNWSAEYFTALDAEVEIRSGSKRLKKVTDLLTAIRSDRRSRAFLVLGDPGSGKSVALRRLCRDLLKEVKKTGKVPLYVNLREWETAEVWTEENPPTDKDLHDFVISNLKDRGDVFTSEFLNKYFRKMFEDGRLFIVLDSFDEIPSVMDVDENSWLVDELSNVIYKFLAGGHESRGVLASRIFRQPTRRFDAKTIFEIRPFTENKIVESLKKARIYSKELANRLFNERQELIPIAKNPFTAALISSYARDHKGELPKNQSDLYSSYIFQRLNACRDRITKKNLSNEEIIAGAIEIADTMLTSQALGLEAPVKELQEKISNDRIEGIIDILRYARLGRLGGGDEKRFSFVHRRFNEYFVVQRLIKTPSKVPTDSIPTDSRWRDALVLYCEVASEPEARLIAEFCWTEVGKLIGEKIDLRDPQYLRSIHCLRFLKEAFRARLNCISLFRNKLAKFIIHQTTAKTNLLSLKLAIEAVGLLREKDIDSVLRKALEINNQWINEVALKSCRYSPGLSKKLSEQLMIAIGRMSKIEFFRKRKEIIFSFRLSNTFNNIVTYCNWHIADCYLLMAGGVLLFFFLPHFSLFFIFYWIVQDRYEQGNLQGVNLALMLRFGAGVVFLSSYSHSRESDRVVFPFVNVLRTSYPELEVLIGVLALMGFLTVIPWWFLYIILPLSSEIDFKKMKENFWKPIIITLVVLCFCLLNVFSFFLIAFPYGLLLPIISICIVLILFVTEMVDEVKKWYSDFLLLRKLKIKTNFDREQIYNALVALRSPGSRYSFIQYIQNAGIKPLGLWPKDKIPYRNVDDEASTLLAQLEEKWLGLDK